MTPDRVVLEEFSSAPLAPVIAPETISLIEQGLVQVVHGAGTATRLRASPYKIAGKTGTSQVVASHLAAKLGERGKPHGWFVAYAPYDAPRIAIAVLVENGGSGSGAAAPVAMLVIDNYLQRLFKESS
jgi:penicillin-binding protein 2